jgi:pimeloyl-ACP methyl ester carboxylesterase
MKEIEAGEPNVGCAGAGPPDGPAVLLLHGWPYDIHSDVDAAPLPAIRGHGGERACFRGYGTTTLLSSETPRKG